MTKITRARLIGEPEEMHIQTKARAPGSRPKFVSARLRRIKDAEKRAYPHAEAGESCGGASSIPSVEAGWNGDSRSIGDSTKIT